MKGSVLRQLHSPAVLNGAHSSACAEVPFLPSFLLLHSLTISTKPFFTNNKTRLHRPRAKTRTGDSEERRGTSLLVKVRAAPTIAQASGRGHAPPPQLPSSSRYSHCLCCIFPPLLAQEPPHLKPKASGLSPTTKTCLKGSANGRKHES